MPKAQAGPSQLAISAPRGLLRPVGNARRTPVLCLGGEAGAGHPATAPSVHGLRHRLPSRPRWCPAPRLGPHRAGGVCGLEGSPGPDGGPPVGRGPLPDSGFIALRTLRPGAGPVAHLGQGHQPPSQGGRSGARSMGSLAATAKASSPVRPAGLRADGRPPRFILSGKGWSQRLHPRTDIL